MRKRQLACAILLLLVCSVATALMIDDFDGAVWNPDGHWRPDNIIQNSGLLDTITFDQALDAEHLVVDYFNDGSGSQTTLVLRDDVSLPVGNWVQLDVAVTNGPQSINIRAGLALASSLGRNAPAKGGIDRANTLLWGLRQDGLGRAHAYGAGGEEFGDATGPIAGYANGKWFTLAIRRADATRFELYQAPTGQPLQLIATINFSGSTGAGESPPTIPGLLLDNGLTSFIALFDNFEIGDDWPPPIRDPRPIATPVPTPPPDVPDDEIALLLPTNIMDLPRIESTRHTVHLPAGAADYTYHHNALLTHWRGRFYMAWTATPQSECTDPYEAWIASSPDGESWTDPINAGVASGGDPIYAQYMRDRFGLSQQSPLTVNAAPRGWNATPDKLYLWSLSWTVSARGRDWVGRIWWTDDGETWHEIAPTELDRLEREDGLRVRGSASNKSFIPLSDGRLMAAAMEGVFQNGKQLCTPITDDPSGLTGWTGGWIDTSDCPDVGEPNGWEGPDGVLHYTVRFGTFVWHAFSNDGGQTWSKLRQQPFFTDNPGNKHFGTLPDGRIFYLGGPIPGSRMQLVLGISADGWIFDQNYLVRWEQIQPIWYSQCKSEDRPGYEYPALLYHDGYLYAAYSRTRDYIEVSKFKASQVLKNTVARRWGGYQ
ncbi:MAG TPA: sialidase family protein [Candidatus Sumerlaeota bacterium]|nr:sialidase family protein [Candidatus Sumerlaeota bacterium]